MKRKVEAPMPKRKTDLSAPFQTIPNTCKITGMSQSWLRTGCKNRTIPYIMAGSTYMINVPVLMQRLNDMSERE